ncbi:hypothetical protein ZIOFF_066011 [Zingiber officinale]|uniref:Uncharacterized protein n=1 Tax=Zingiber officinale TaxID=94328 RepID=A0A8J5EY28_ZINOF|nr:hypothetical protein ZIOFF_066011 [Zingiber officinale]
MRVDADGGKAGQEKTQQQKKKKSCSSGDDLAGVGNAPKAEVSPKQAEGVKGELAKEEVSLKKPGRLSASERRVLKEKGIIGILSLMYAGSIYVHAYYAGRSSENSMVCKDSQLVGSLSNGWTDEKHVIFLNCIESAFVNELYNEKYETNAFHGWLSRMKMPKGSCGQCENDQKAGQFKVLRMSSWKNFIYDMDKIDAETETGLMPLSANPWIQHFRPTCIMKEKNLKSSDKIDYSHLTRPSVHLENDGHYGEGTSSKHNCCQDSVGSNAGIWQGISLILHLAEVSDQNFVDDELISEKRSTISLKRKPGAQVAHNSINNQLPSKKAFVSPISVANHTSLCTVNSESSSRTWEVDSILVLSETEAPLYDDEEVNS